MTPIDYELILILKLIIAAGLGAILGLEREYTKHEAGLRTMMLVCLGSCAFMLMGFYSNQYIDEVTGDALEPSKVLAGIVTGIGFLGAGVIMKEGLNVKGLTTAATIWVAAGIGVSVAAEQFVIAVALTIIAASVLLIIGKVEGKMGIKFERACLTVRGKPRKGIQKVVQKHLKDEKVKVVTMSMNMTETEVVLKYDVEMPMRFDTTEATIKLTDNKNIDGVDWDC